MLGKQLLDDLLAPVHVDLPVGGRRQRDPGDCSSVVGAVSTTKDHLAALCTIAKILHTQRERIIS